MLLDIENLGSSLNSAAVWHMISFWAYFLIYRNERVDKVIFKILPGLISYCSN